MSTKRIFEVPTSFLSVSAMIGIGPVAGKRTSDCFTSSRYWNRDDRLDEWLPADQPDAHTCTISSLALQTGEIWNYAKVAAALLGIGASADEIAFLGRLLVREGREEETILNKLLAERLHTFTLAQIEEMVEITERGNDCLLTDGNADHFFVETGDTESPVLLGCIGRKFSKEKKAPDFTRYWSVNALGSPGFGRCLDHTDRLLIRNLNGLET